MSETATKKTASSSSSGSTSSSTDVQSSSSSSSALVTEQGKTSIADGVVAKIAGIAAREVSGVHSLGGASARAVGAVRERLGQKSHSQGVSVEVGERQAAVDVDVVVEYGAGIVDVANGIRRNVIDSLERMTGLEVTEVNVSVNDIYVESEDRGADQQQAPPRVQ